MRSREKRRQKTVGEALDQLSRELEEARGIRGYAARTVARAEAVERWRAYCAS